jgi:hypothetical protein
MNCYLCLLESGSAAHPAVAVCQCCGAAMCETHLVDPQKGSFVSPGGMSGFYSMRRLICSLCYDAAFPSKRPHRPAQPEKDQDGEEGGWRGRWWRWLRGHRPSRSSALPPSQEAITLVEDFLKRQRSG